MKAWSTKVVSEFNLEIELNAYSEQGWEILKVDFLGQDIAYGSRIYSIVAYREIR
jgi:hypothetical protein